MSATHAATHNEDTDWLGSAFTVAAAGTAAGALGLLSAPAALCFGAAAAIAGIGMLGRAVSGDNTNVALVAAIVATATTFITGLPMEFLSEAIVFPWAHDTAFGAETMAASGSYLVPIYDTIGSWFGIEPFGQAASGVPVADI
ncbi:MAG: hypothetical protein ACRBDI_07425 [Alphaproteobacteria bacterium]